MNLEQEGKGNKGIYLVFLFLFFFSFLFFSFFFFSQIIEFISALLMIVIINFNYLFRFPPLNCLIMYCIFFPFSPFFRFTCDKLQIFTAYILFLIHFPPTFFQREINNFRGRFISRTKYINSPNNVSAR